MTPAGSFQITATVRPDRDDLSRLQALVRAGAGRLRLNLSHLTPDELTEFLLLHRRLEKTDGPLPLVLDLQGGKFRIARCRKKPVAAGETLRLGIEPGDADLTLPQADCLAALRPGMEIRIDDGRLSLECLTATGNEAHCRVLRPGRLRPGAGVVLPDAPDLPGFTLRDREFLARLCAASDTVELALSHCRRAADLEELRRQAPGRRIHAKVELRAAFPRLRDFEQFADELWLCRGDLGAEAGMAALPRLEAEFFRPPTGPRPRLLAGQILHVFAADDEATRSEIVYLAGHLRAGLAGVILSDETLHSVDPCRPVACLRELASIFSPETS